MKRRESLCYVLSIVLSGIIACLDANSHSDDAPMVIIALWLVSACVMGALEPVKPWRWAFCLMLGVPVIHLIRRFLHLPDNINPNTFATIMLIAVVGVIATTIGATIGAVVKKAFTEQTA